jgi:AAA domain
LAGLGANVTSIDISEPQIEIARSHAAALGVGKTTFARRLEHDLSAVRFTHDEWMTQLYGEDPHVECAELEDMRRRVHVLMEPVWSRCLQSGLDVVLDFGLWSRQERDVLRVKIAALGALARLYRVTLLPRLQPARGARFQFASYLKRSEVVPVCKQGSVRTGRQPGSFRPAYIGHG